MLSTNNVSSVVNKDVHWIRLLRLKGEINSRTPCYFYAVKQCMVWMIWYLLVQTSMKNKDEFYLLNRAKDLLLSSYLFNVCAVYNYHALNVKCFDNTIQLMGLILHH